MRRAARLLTLVACLALATAAAAQTPPTTAAPAVVGSVGVAVPTSGKYGPLGRQIAQAAKLAAAEVGLRVVVADTEGEPSAAVAAVEALAKDPQVIAIVGPLGVRESQAAAQAAQRAQVPLFTLSTNESVNHAGGWVFRVRTSPAEQARALADLAFDRMDARTAAVMYPQNLYGDEAARAFATRFIERGGRVTAVANYPEDTTDFEDVLDVVVARKVYLGKRSTVGKWRTDGSGFARLGSKARVDFEVLFVPDFHYRVARILPFLPGAGIQNGEGGEGTAVQLLGLSGWQGKAMELSGATAAGAIYVDTFVGAAAGGRQDEFARTFEAATSRHPVDVEAETFDIVWLLSTLAKEAAKEGTPAGKLRAEVVRRLPTRTAWRGVAGPLRFGRRGEPLRVLGVYRFDVDGAVAPAY